MLVSPVLWIALAIPAALTVVCVLFMARVRHCFHLETARRYATGPQREFVLLSRAEHEAFAGLVQRLNDGT